MSSEKIQINGGNDSTSHSNAPPSDNDLDQIFDSLSNGHANQEWTSETHDDDASPVSTAGVTPSWTSHDDDVQENAWHEDDVSNLVDALGNHPNADGWTSHDDDVQENAWHEDDANDLVDALGNHPNADGWTSHEDDVQENAWHEDDVNDLVDALGNHPNSEWTSHDDDVQDNAWHEDDVNDLVDALGNHPNSEWTSHDDDVETQTDSTEPKNFDELIDVCLIRYCLFLTVPLI